MAARSQLSPSRPVKEAEELLTDEEFRKDVTFLRDEGRPLWNGEVALRLRDATPEERSEYKNSEVYDDDASDGDASDDEDDESMVMFIVDVDEPGGPDDARH